MKTLYLDIFSGISGDMFIGALLDLGVDFHQLEIELAKLQLDGYTLRHARKQKANIEGVKFDVLLTAPPVTPAPAAPPHATPEPAAESHKHEGHTHVHGDDDHHHAHDHAHGEAGDPAHHHSHAGQRTFAQIRELIETSPLSEWVKAKAIAVFHRVAVAEGKIHGRSPEEVHFHEVGAVDSIVDIVGACVALELLERPRVLAASVVEGSGWVKCAHGRFPVPTAATLEILGARGIPISQCDEPHELVTPTGAALLAEFAEGFGPMRGLVASRIGYGLGTRDHHTRPNALRAVLGQIVEGQPHTPATAPLAVENLGHHSSHDWDADSVMVLETNVDDINCEILGYVVELAMFAGALDVFHTPIQMKKNRPGVLLTVLCPPSEVDLFTELLLRETTTFGVRRYLVERRKLRREFGSVDTPYGKVQVKYGRLNGKIVQSAPEFESCRGIATQENVPLKFVYAAALRALEEAHERG